MSAMTSKNKDLMRRVYEEMWNQGDATLAREIFERHTGVEGAVSQFLTSFPDLQHTVEEMIEEDNRVVVRFTAKGTHAGQWMDFVPTGTSIQYTGITLARIAGDKIVKHQTWWDKAGLIEQITGGKQ